MKNILKITGVIQREGEHPITEKDAEAIKNLIYETLKRNKLMFGGGFKHMTPLEYFESDECQCDPDLLKSDNKCTNCGKSILK